jgi:glycosyltransferase involved in cell wall biosynthesis
MQVSVLLLSMNEERNLPGCLASLAWCDDIILVDSGSTDASVEIARRANVRVLTRPFDNCANQRNFGLTEGAPRHEWVLHLDADEVATPQFQAKLSALVPREGIDAYRVPSKTMLNGRWLRYAGMYPTYQVRLGHRERLRFIHVGHGQREDLPPARVATFEEPYLHYTFSHGLAAWLRKHVTYAEDEARLLLAQRKSGGGLSQLFSWNSTTRRRGMKALANWLPLWTRPLARFFYVYIVRRGFLDGRSGVAYAFMLATYEGMIAILASEAKNTTD